jgi:3-(3-hydroxy-phenyl)propionate hydroxylase
MAKAEPNIELHLSTEFVSFEQDADGVVAHVVNAAGEKESFSGRYIVSAEGARSAVRKQLDIAFEGFTYDDRTLNIEVAYDFRKHGYAERNYISDPAEWSNLFHWKGPPDRCSTSSAATSMSCTSVSRTNSASAAPSWPAIPRT